MGEQVVCGGGPRAGTAGINSGSSCEALYCESEFLCLVDYKTQNSLQ
jgi:hypothetical protein